MPVRYATLDLVEGDFNAAGGNSADRALLFTYLDFASRRVEEFCNRRFDQQVEPRRYDAEGWHIPESNTLELDADLLELAAILNGDGESIDVENAILAPYNTYPKSKIILTEDTWTYEATPYAAIEITGAWGFHRKPSRAWQSAGVSVPEGDLAEDATSLVLENTGVIERGHVLKIDEEQMSVEDIAEGTGSCTLTLERDLNGTDAAAHDAGTAIYVYVPEETVQRATARVAVWMYRQRDAPFEKVVTPMGEVVVPVGLPGDVRDMLRLGGFMRSEDGEVMYVVE